MMNTTVSPSLHGLYAALKKRRIQEWDARFERWTAMYGGEEPEPTLTVDLACNNQTLHNKTFPFISKRKQKRDNLSATTNRSPSQQATNKLVNSNCSNFSTSVTITKKTATNVDIGVETQELALTSSRRKVRKPRERSFLNGNQNESNETSCIVSKKTTDSGTRGLPCEDGNKRKASDCTAVQELNIKQRRVLDVETQDAGTEYHGTAQEDVVSICFLSPKPKRAALPYSDTADEVTVETCFLTPRQQAVTEDDDDDDDVVYLGESAPKSKLQFKVLPNGRDLGQTSKPLTLNSKISRN